MPKPSVEECEVCGLSYAAFRTGLDFATVRMLLWRGPDPSTWVYKRRHTVLGLWHQLKLEMWDAHLEECEQGTDYD